MQYIFPYNNFFVAELVFIPDPTENDMEMQMKDKGIFPQQKHTLYASVFNKIIDKCWPAISLSEHITNVFFQYCKKFRTGRNYYQASCIEWNIRRASYILATNHDTHSCKFQHLKALSAMGSPSKCCNTVRQILFCDIQIVQVVKIYLQTIGKSTISISCLLMTRQ